MKIGTLVGAVGMALAGAAVAENVSVSSVSPSAALESAMPNPAHQVPIRTSAYRDVMDPDRLKKAREEGFGLPTVGSPGFAAAAREVRSMIDSGQISPWHSLIPAKHLGIKALQDEAIAFSRSDEPSTNSSVGRGVNNPMGVDIDYFDGYESYTPDPDPSDGMFGAFEIDNQVQPSGLPGGASFFYVAVDWNNPLNVPAIGTEPRDPYNGGLPPGGDAVPGLNQVLLNGQGWFGSALTGTFLGYGLTAADVFIPSAGQALVACGDFYFDDFETTVPWSPTSGLENFIVSRVLMTGYFFGSPLSEPNGQIRRPQVLGPDPGLFSIGQFFAPPINPAAGLATKQIQLQEWFTVAFRLSPSTMHCFMRDSQTDGSAGTTIDDQRDFQFFELGWSEIYPGQAATDLGGGTFAGHGRAVNDFLALASDPSPIIAAISCDGVFTTIGGDPTPEQIPGWLPTNNYHDNFCIIGDVLPEPAQPKQVLPYKDDIELYFVGGPLILQGDTWTDNLSSRAFISTAGNTSPSPGSDGGPSVQSIQQDSVIEDSRFRTEFSTVTPHDQRNGGVGAADSHPVATPGCPVCVSANIFITAPTTIRAMSVTDTFILGVAEQVLLGVADDFDMIDDTIHIRLPNGAFDPALPTTTGLRVDSPPDIADNSFNLNYPTKTALAADGLLNVFFALKLTLYGDGTAEWSVDGTPLEFDDIFLTTNGLEADFQEAKMLAGQPAPMSPPYTRFLSDQFSLNTSAFQSGNNLGGFFDAILVDDFCVDAKGFNPGPGPVFELPLCDDMECYALDLPIAQQGDTPFVFAASVDDANLDFSERAIRVVDCPPLGTLPNISSVKLDAAGLVLDAGTLYCVYTVGGGAASIGGPGTEVAVLKEKLTSCPLSVNLDLCTAKDVTDSGVWALTGDCVGGDTLAGTETAALFIQSEVKDFGAAVDWCVYTACEVFVGTDRKGLPNPNDWCLMTDDLIYVKKPTNKAAFTCPDRVKCAGAADLILVDPDDMDDMTTELNPCFMNFSLNPTCPNTGIPECADYTMQFQRNDGNELFCRYQIATINALPDPSMGGTPFVLPAALTVGAVVAVDAVFAEDMDEGFTPCPGTVPGPSNFDLNDPKTGCPIASGTWTIQDTAVDSMAVTVGVAAAFQATDVKGYGIDADGFPMWADPGAGNAAAGGTGGDGWIRLGSAATDDVLTEIAGSDVFIDPGGVFGQVVCFVNNAGSSFNDNQTVNSAVATWPDAIALAEPNGPNMGEVVACVYWDLYVQDNNSALGFRITGNGTDGTGGTIMNIRFGGPGGSIDNHAANEIAVEVDNPDMTPFPPPPPFIYGGTGVIVPLNAWFRVCVEVDSDGNWKAGINTAGNPGGPGDVPENFDDTLMGAHPDAQLVATGTSQAQDGAGFNIADISGWQVEQSFNEEGDGIATFSDITIRALASDAASPTPASPNNFCFYRVASVDVGGTGPMIRGVDPVTGAVDAMDRVINGQQADTIAVKFEAGITDGMAGTTDVLSFADCPPNGDFIFVDNSPVNVGTSMGQWTLVGFPDAEEANPPPVGGISNADGVTDGFAYNFPNTPADNILLACYEIIPPLPAEEISSKWYVDNIKVKEVEIIPVPPCPWDLNGDGSVGSADLAFLGGSWGNPGCSGMLPCPADFDGNGSVGSTDQAQLLGAWGPCPM